MSDTTSCDIHIEYRETHYDGDSHHEADITYAYPGNKECNVTIHYEDDNYLSPCHERIAQDIIEYMQDPSKWIDEWIRQGPDSLMKLREIEDDIRERNDSIASSQRSIDYSTKRKQELEQQAKKLRKQLALKSQ